MSKSDVVFKLTIGGGPEPMFELTRVLQAAQEDPAGLSWIATRKPGSGFVARPDSQLLAFAQAPAGNALALTARVVSRHEVLPSDALVRDMYEGWKEVCRAYWRIADVSLRLVPFEELPGTTLKGLRIADAFRSQLSFAYWLPTGRADGSRHARPARAPARTRAAPRPTGPAPELVPIQRVESPSTPLHGVDFSGARETGGRNGKIWIASWYPNRELVELRSGGDDPGFDRVGLTGRIIESGGTWVIDFPFGPAAAVATAAGWTTWYEYLAWCGSNPVPTVLRDQLRQILQAAGMPWATTRESDHALGTTWFPFFEQLYRQTITGGRDVLAPLDQAGRDRTRLLPFHDHAAATAELSVVIEGFPGHTLTTLGLPRTGYKHRTLPAQESRAQIVNALRERGVPISDADATTAINDGEGDAVDALVLLHAAQGASLRTTAEWAAVGAQASIEGWFFD